jgi:hypothetical protein
MSSTVPAFGYGTTGTGIIPTVMPVSVPSAGLNWGALMKGEKPSGTWKLIASIT